MPPPGEGVAMVAAKICTNLQETSGSRANGSCWECLGKTQRAAALSAVQQNIASMVWLRLLARR